MTADAARVAASVDALVRRLQVEATQGPLTPKEALVLRLDQQYPHVRPRLPYMLPLAHPQFYVGRSGSISL